MNAVAVVVLTLVRRQNLTSLAVCVLRCALLLLKS